jgi:hypothetical protein
VASLIAVMDHCSLLGPAWNRRLTGISFSQRRVHNLARCRLSRAWPPYLGLPT